MVSGTSVMAQELPVQISAMVWPCLLLSPDALSYIGSHCTEENRETFSTVAIRVQPQQCESPTVRQLPAGSRAFSTVSSNPSGSKCRESSLEKCSASTNQIITGGAIWIRYILRNTLELTFRDQTKPRKNFPSLVVIILWGSFLHWKTAREMQNQHRFYQVF